MVLVLGDQLDAKSVAFDGFDRKVDAVWMAEVAEESTHVWSHQARIALLPGVCGLSFLALVAALAVRLG